MSHSKRPQDLFSSLLHLLTHFAALRIIPSLASRRYKPSFYFSLWAFGEPRLFCRMLYPCKANSPC